MSFRVTLSVAGGFHFNPKWEERSFSFQKHRRVEHSQYSQDNVHDRFKPGSAGSKKSRETCTTLKTHFIKCSCRPVRQCCLDLSLTSVRARRFYSSINKRENLFGLFTLRERVSHLGGTLYYT